MGSRWPVITLTTDFGNQDHYVSAMKAMILRIHDGVRLVDISHEIPPQDVMAGAWVIRNSAFLFPEGTIHVAVVDPGVGTTRKPIVAKINGHYFVGPDNGLFSLLLEDEQQDYRVFELSEPSFWVEQPSDTFHGRDIFAPVAAHLSSGVAIEETGKAMDALTTYKWAMPISDDEGIQGWVVHIDRYGNLITNISREMLGDLKQGGEVKIYVGNTILKGINRTFGDVEEGEPAAIVGSSGMLEIAINKGNAAELMSVYKGAPVSVIYRSR